MAMTKNLETFIAMIGIECDNNPRQRHNIGVMHQREIVKIKQTIVHLYPLYTVLLSTYFHYQFFFFFFPSLGWRDKYAKLTRVSLYMIPFPFDFWKSRATFLPSLSLSLPLGSELWSCTCSLEFWVWWDEMINWLSHGLGTFLKQTDKPRDLKDNKLMMMMMIYSIWSITNLNIFDLRRYKS